MKDISFEYDRSTVNDPYVIKASVKETVFPVIALVDKGGMYQAGLELNFKHLVDMKEVADTITSMLNMYSAIDKLNETNYYQLMGVFSPFMEKSLDYDKFSRKVDQALEDNML